MCDWDGSASRELCDAEADCYWCLCKLLAGLSTCHSCIRSNGGCFSRVTRVFARMEAVVHVSLAYSLDWHRRGRLNLRCIFYARGGYGRSDIGGEREAPLKRVVE